MQLEYINNESKNKTIRDVLVHEFHIAGRLISKLKKEKAILLNGEPMYIDKEINLGDRLIIRIDFYESLNEKILPVEMKLDVLYEDDSILVVNKPPFTPVHPSSSHLIDTLSNGVQYYFKKNSINHKIRLVNRLDRDTSGIVIFAKNAYIQECLIRQMKKNNFHKEYIALVDGYFKEDTGKINASISRKEGSIIEREINPNGDIAITYFNKIKQFDNYAEVKFILETGRTHQIRVHSKYIGNPILGDTLYGTSSPLINRQALHAYKVEFIHPITKEILKIKAPIPKDIETLIKVNL